MRGGGRRNRWGDQEEKDGEGSGGERKGVGESLKIEIYQQV